MKFALLESAAALLPTVEQHHPDWFRESADELKLALQHWNKLYSKRLATKKAGDHLQFGKHEDKFRKPLEGPRMSGSKPRLRKWNGSGLAGRRSGRTSVTCNEDGEACCLH